MARKIALSFLSIVAVICLILEQTRAQDASLTDSLLDVEKRSLARNEDYYAEDDDLLDTSDCWRLEPMDLLLQFNSRKRRDAIQERNIRASNALLDDTLVDSDIDRVRRQVDDDEDSGTLTKQERRRLKQEEKRKKKEYREQRKALRKAQRALRRLARLRKKQERLEKKFNRQKFREALEAGNEAVLERMLGMDIDMKIDMEKVCKAGGHHAGAHAHVTCDPEAKYRTMNGSCNNLQHPSWGSTLEPLVRWLEANYSGHGNFLPRDFEDSPRKQSTSFAEIDDGGDDKAHHGCSILMMHFGQFLDHDMTHTPAAHDNCDCKTLNSSCFPLHVPSDDRYMKDKVCFEIPRTLPHCGDEKRREQFNEITAFIDASNVYGSNDHEIHYLRLYVQDDSDPETIASASGRLRVHEVLDVENRKPLLPHHDEESGNCFGEVTGKIVCGEAGDFRVNEQPGLTSLHTIFVRLHNVIAEGLKQRNPGWVSDSDRVFETARTIVAAIMQNIIYREYLPTLLGEEGFDIYIGEYEGYDPEDNPSISNVFATSGFRQGHSAVADHLERYRVDVDGNPTRLLPLPIAKAFFNARFMYDFDNEGIDGFMQGMVRQTARKIDHFFSATLLNRLFVAPDDDDKDMGLDLVSLNVLRGRDNGIQPYYRWREFCGLPELNTWSDLLGPMTETTIARLIQTYGGDDEDIQKIDPFIGFMAEEPAHGGMVGPTLTCILGRQFKSLRDGDRFYFQNPVGPQALTEAQQNAISDVTMARVLCETLDNPVKFQHNVFKLEDDVNNLSLDCLSDNFKKLDLDPWCEAC